MCPVGNVAENGLMWQTLPRCVAEDFDCPLPSILPEGYKVVGKEVVCEEGYVGSFVSRRCGHDSACHKVLELTGCVKPVPCAPLKIEPCERDNLACSRLETPVGSDARLLSSVNRHWPPAQRGTQIQRHRWTTICQAAFALIHR
ncbi:unnamed protein product [Durusdinium trenchii]|uniref:Uncharacterized protein n=1 Tax=Durusdinium trenchii TaxID=1381693 RepID=A0ABP0K5B4_9DINO